MRSEIVSGKGRLLGVDFGDRRTGIAVCDNTRFIASARETIVNNGLSDCVRQVVEIAKAENVSGIVIGRKLRRESRKVQIFRVAR